MKAQTQLFLALSRSFLPPTGEMARAMLASLPEDLAQLCAAAGHSADEPLRRLTDALAALAGPEALLVHYSHLFLPPQAVVSLNLAVHLDGCAHGGAMDALEAALGRFGLAKAEAFHDLPDHLALVLEAFACLIEEEVAPEEQAAFARAFLKPALARVAAAIEDEDATSPYLALLRLLRSLIVRVAPELASDPRRERAAKRADLDIGLWRECQTCGRPYAREKELRIMAKALEAQGLPTAHLADCPDCRKPSGDWLAQTRAAETLADA